MNEMIVQSEMSSCINTIRGEQVMLDRDLAELYQVDTKRLNEQVKRNIDRFPNDFMFQLTDNELENWKSQYATSNKEIKGLRKMPYAFSEEDAAFDKLRHRILASFVTELFRSESSKKEWLSWHMHILKCSDSSYYTGSTKDMERRLWQHQNGEGAYHTKARLPVTLVYVEHYDRVEEAFAREKQIQGWSRKKKEALILGDVDALCRFSTSTSSVTNSTSSATNIIDNRGTVTELAEVK